MPGIERVGEKDKTTGQQSWADVPAGSPWMTRMRTLLLDVGTLIVLPSPGMKATLLFRVERNALYFEAAGLARRRGTIQRSPEVIFGPKAEERPAL